MTAAHHEVYLPQQAALVVAYVAFIDGGDEQDIERLAMALRELHAAMSSAAGWRDHVFESFPLAQRRWDHHEIFPRAKRIVERLGVHDKVDGQLEMYRKAELRRRAQAARTSAPKAPRIEVPAGAQPAIDALVATYQVLSDNPRSIVAAEDAYQDVYRALEGLPEREQVYSLFQNESAAWTSGRLRLAIHAVLRQLGCTPPSPPSPAATSPAPSPASTELPPLTPEQQAPLHALSQALAAAGFRPAQPPQALPPSVGGNPIVKRDNGEQDPGIEIAGGPIDEGERDPGILFSDELEEELQPIAEEIRGHIAAANRGERDAHFAIGMLAYTVRTDSKYGDGAVDRLAGAVGQEPRTLRRAAAVAERWSRADYEVLAARTTSRGEQISWSQLVLLATVRDDAYRAELLEAVFDRGLTKRQLEGAIRAPKTEAKLPPNVVRTLVKRAKSMAEEVSQATPGIARAGTAEERAELTDQLGALEEAMSKMQEKLRPPSLSEALGEPGLKLETETETETTKRDPS